MGGRVIAPVILNLTTGQGKRSASCASSFPKESLQYAMNVRGWGGPKGGLDGLNQRKVPLLGARPLFLHYPACYVVTIVTMLL